MPEQDDPRLYCLFCRENFPGHHHPVRGEENFVWHAQFEASMEEFLRWDALTPRQKCDEIVETYPPEDWVITESLNILAVFYDVPTQWLKIVTVGRQIGVDIYGLEKTVKALRERHARWKDDMLSRGEYYQREET